MKIIKVDIEKQGIVENFMQLYLHDLSPYTGESVEADGKFDLGPYFNAYWSDEDRFPYLYTINNIPVGFALVRRLTNGLFAVSEFFILRSHRRQGIAIQFAHEVFKQHRAQWQVAQIETNTPAQDFWRQAISSFTGNDFVEEWSKSEPIGPKQVFQSPT